MSPLAPSGAMDSATRPVLDVPGPRWFGPDDAVWRVHGDVSTPIGITTGLLMLAANPAFAAIYAACGAVEDPWLADDYLHDLVEISTFGTVDDAVVTIEHAHTDRSSYSGHTEHGDFYYGADPELTAWAQAATTWSLLVAYQRFSGRPLTRVESDEYVEQSARLARLQGVRTAPTTVRELERLLRGATDRVRATGPGRRLATRLRETARPCRGAVDTSVASVTGHKRCATVVDAATGLAPSDVRRALGLPTRVVDRAAVFGRLAEAHRGVSAPRLTTRAPIAAPSAMLAVTD